MPVRSLKVKRKFKVKGGKKIKHNIGIKSKKRFKFSKSKKGLKGGIKLKKSLKNIKIKKNIKTLKGGSSCIGPAELCNLYQHMKYTTQYNNDILDGHPRTTNPSPVSQPFLGSH